MVEPPEEDLEAGNTSSSSPPSIAEVHKTDDIDMTDFQEMNDNLGQGDEDNLDELAHDDEGVETKDVLANDDERVETKEELAHDHEGVETKDELAYDDEGLKTKKKKIFLEFPDELDHLKH